MSGMLRTVQDLLTAIDAGEVGLMEAHNWIDHYFGDNQVMARVTKEGVDQRCRKLLFSGNATMRPSRRECPWCVELQGLNEPTIIRYLDMPAGLIDHGMCPVCTAIFEDQVAEKKEAIAV